MKWTREADQALSRVPFFVRKRVRKRVEEEAVRRGSREVHLEHVQSCQRRYLESMADEVKGYQVENCFGPSGCPNRAVSCDGLAQKLDDHLDKRELKAFLKKKVEGPLKLHHEFRISISDCPNACSRPQIADVGLIGACKPRVSSANSCNQCGVCIEVCREGAISLDEDGMPVIQDHRCLSCGQCLTVCPTGTLQEEAQGYRILVGGKLGRHPRLATELPGVRGEEEVLRIIEQGLDHYQAHCLKGERFGEILERTGLETLFEGLEDESEGGGEKISDP